MSCARKKHTYIGPTDSKAWNEIYSNRFEKQNIDSAVTFKGGLWLARDSWETERTVDYGVRAAHR